MNRDRPTTPRLRSSDRAMAVLLACCLSLLAVGDLSARPAPGPNRGGVWGGHCRRVGLSPRRCRRTYRRGRPVRLYRLIRRLSRRLERVVGKRKTTTPVQRRDARNRPFKVSKWWWDIPHPRYAGWVEVDGIARLTERALSRWRGPTYKQILLGLASLVGNPRVTPRLEVTVVSRLRRLLLRRRHQAVVAAVTRKMVAEMAAARDCPHWYTKFLALHHSPGWMRKLSAGLDPAHCGQRKEFLRQKYRRYREIVESMRWLSRRHRGYARLRRFGRSREGRPLWALRLGGRSR